MALELDPQHRYNIVCTYSFSNWFFIALIIVKNAHCENWDIFFSFECVTIHNWVSFMCWAISRYRQFTRLSHWIEKYNELGQWLLCLFLLTFSFSWFCNSATIVNVCLGGMKLLNIWHLRNEFVCINSLSWNEFDNNRLAKWHICFGMIRMRYFHVFSRLSYFAGVISL